jgi:hypothetical protein
VYLVFTVAVMVGFAANQAGTVAGQRIVVDLNRQYTGPGSPAGVLGVLAVAGASELVVAPAVVARVRRPPGRQLAARIESATPGA